MNCSTCGTPIPFDERYCRNCGREVVPIAPTVYSGGAGQPSSDSRPTERFIDPMQTESLNPKPQTARDWVPPIVQTSPPPQIKQDRRSMLVPIAVASIVIALVSLGALAYIMMSKDKAGETGTTSQEKPQASVAPSVATSSPNPTPTVQTSPSPTPSPTPKPTPRNEPPPGARLAYCNDTNVIVRSAPELNAKPITKITRGQNVWVIGSSSNYSTWKGITSNWTQVQIYNGTLRGWVFSPFISYQTDAN
jgi:hypothetical protein